MTADIIPFPASRTKPPPAAKHAPSWRRVDDTAAPYIPRRGDSVRFEDYAGGVHEGFILEIRDPGIYAGWLEMRIHCFDGITRHAVHEKPELFS